MCSSSSAMRARSCSFSHSSCRFSSRNRETSMAVSRILASSNSNFSAYMLSPFTPLDRARLLVLMRVRLFGELLQHGHETVQTLAHLGILLLEHLPLAFRLHAALTPLVRQGAVLRLVLAPRQRATQGLTLIFRDHIGAPASLALND